MSCSCQSFCVLVSVFWFYFNFFRLCSQVQSDRSRGEVFKGISNVKTLWVLASRLQTNKSALLRHTYGHWRQWNTAKPLLHRKRAYGSSWGGGGILTAAERLQKAREKSEVNKSYRKASMGIKRNLPCLPELAPGSHSWSFFSIFFFSFLCMNFARFCGHCFVVFPVV